METGPGCKDALVTGAFGGSGATRVRGRPAEGASGLLLSLRNGNNRVPSAPGAPLLRELERG